MAESQNPSEIERNWRKMFRLVASIGIYTYISLKTFILKNIVLAIKKMLEKYYGAFFSVSVKKV